MYIGIHVQYRLFLSDFNETWIFIEWFSKNSQVSNVTKIRPVEAKLLRAERHDKAKTVAFRNFAKKKSTKWSH